MQGIAFVIADGHVKTLTPEIGWKVKKKPQERPVTRLHPGLMERPFGKLWHSPLPSPPHIITPALSGGHLGPTAADDVIVSVGSQAKLCPLTAGVVEATVAWLSANQP
ncbi:hypothetical protein Bbelb_429340 [Branchiostoma belcheri]|nr:hypothetical protein Bbelb_429340 [Branchiostoma belcheri]